MRFGTPDQFVNLREMLMQSGYTEVSICQPERPPRRAARATLAHDVGPKLVSSRCQLAATAGLTASKSHGEF
jgi:hypothetical protein